MNTKSTVSNQVTVSNEQWLEINKLSQICKIKNQIANLLEDAPELNIDEVFDFLYGLTADEIKSRK